MLRFLAKSDYHIRTSLYKCWYKWFIYFFRQKKTTNEANCSEVNRNLLHSLEESSRFRGQQHHSLGITTGLVSMLPYLIISEGAFHLSELTGQTIPVPIRISLLIKTFNYSVSHFLNSMHEGACFSAKTLGKTLFLCQNDQSGHGPAGQFWLLESTLSVGLSWLRVFLWWGCGHLWWLQSPSCCCTAIFFSNCLSCLLKI